MVTLSNEAECDEALKSGHPLETDVNLKSENHY
jgi:hypothetical protein